jgi:hypothetical protein
MRPDVSMAPDRTGTVRDRMQRTDVGSDALDEK